MLRWVLEFLVVAVLAAAIGFTGMAPRDATLAKVLFLIFLVLFVVSLVRDLTKEQL